MRTLVNVRPAYYCDTSCSASETRSAQDIQDASILCSCSAAVDVIACSGVQCKWMEMGKEGECVCVCVCVCVGLH